jgi:hypothetical protein
MTECSETLFPFEAHFSRQVVAQFEGSWLTTEGGSLLLRQADRKIGLLRRVASCFTDYRQPERIEHRLEEMLAQRIYGLALGYEDLNDHEQLRQDPLLAVLAGKRDLSDMWVAPHVAQNLGRRGGSAIDNRTTLHQGYALSQKKRKRIEECFGWLKTIALMRKVRHRGTLKVDWIFTFACAAYNLVRMRNLMRSIVPT